METETINPTWQAAIQIHLAALIEATETLAHNPPPEVEQRARRSYSSSKDAIEQCAKELDRAKNLPQRLTIGAVISQVFGERKILEEGDYHVISVVVVNDTNFEVICSHTAENRTYKITIESPDNVDDVPANVEEVKYWLKHTAGCLLSNECEKNLWAFLVDEFLKI
jgi:hypothetical protein